MKKITINITLSKVFESCQQWSQNRAWLKDNPNKSRDLTNFTYAISEDDEIFFEEYIETVVAEVSIDNLLRLFRRYTSKCFAEDYEFDYNNDFAKFNYVVSNRFSAKALHILLFQYIKYKVLYYWYWEKNMYEELQFVEIELEKLSEKIKNTSINEAKTNDTDKDGKGGEPMDIVPYNDGFTINPPKRHRELPALYDESEVVGDIKEVTSIAVADNQSIYVGQSISINDLYTYKPSDAQKPQITTKIVKYNTTSNEWDEEQVQQIPFVITDNQLMGYCHYPNDRFAIKITNIDNATMTGICEIVIMPNRLVITKDLGE